MIFKIMSQNYENFIKGKVALAKTQGFDISLNEINPILKPFQKACVQWAIAGGCRALFESFGLGKSVQQLEICRLVLSRLGTGRGLIVAPLGVRQEFKRDAEMLGIEIKFVRRTEEVLSDGIYLTNYESVRDDKLDLSLFDVVSLDEASCLRSFGSKTFSQFLFEGKMPDVPFKFVATATPSPNEYQELLAYAHFLGIMDIGQARTRFFKRNSEKSDDLTLHKHKEKEFWLWVSSWAIFLQKPSDLGFDDSGYELPEMKIFFHELPVDHSTAVPDKFGQNQLFRNAALGVIEASKEKRETLPLRIEKMLQLLNSNPDDNFILWHDLEAERHAIKKAVPSSSVVFGSQSLDEREEIIINFSDGKLKYLAGKPQMLGSGCNFQRHCHKAIFLGIGYKFNDFLQAIHRIHRFLQNKPVEIHLIYAESEKLVMENLLDKWERDKEQRRIMTQIIKKYGLSQEAMKNELTRAFGVERIEITGENFTLVNNDSVKEAALMKDNSIDLLLTSIPFSNQYEYSPNYNDFGHTEDIGQFFTQMDFLTPHLLRVLKPGRIAAIHVKDRIVPSAMTGLGFQVVHPFHADCITHYTKHGFAYMGMKTIVTDVVRENNQTYRLGWTEQCKDGTKMGCGMPEYLLLFRKPPTETNNSYADFPVVKSKEKYTRARWQIDAHGFMRVSGNRLLNPEELVNLPWNVIYKLFREYSFKNVYDFEHHVRIGEALDLAGRLPVDFMLLPPQSSHPDVWTDITRMRTLNASQAQKGKQLHICPLQFDICDRVIEQFSMEGETVFDPFGGIMTTIYRALKLRRKGYGIELNHNYFLDGAHHCKAMEQQVRTPTLFDLNEIETLEVAA